MMPRRAAKDTRDSVGDAAIEVTRAKWMVFACPQKMDGFCGVRVEIAAVAYGSFAMTLLAYFL